MIPFNVDASWFETHWLGNTALPARGHRAESRRSTKLGKIAAAAALLTAIGGGVALAQGAPPGYAPWHSGWPGFIDSHQPHAASARNATPTLPGGSTATARSGRPAPVASEVQDRRGRG